MSEGIKHLRAVINPMAGRREPIVQTLFAQFKDAPFQWDIKISRDAADIPDIIQQAQNDGVDVIAVYGGDGTILRVVRSILETDIRLAILPGGSGNILAKTLGIPLNLKKACQFLCGEHPQTQSVDVGEFNGEYFLTRICMGFEAEVVEATDRVWQNRIGMLAYGLATLKALRKVRVSEYVITIDGLEYRIKGLACFVANSSNVGLPSVNLLSQSSVTDSKLDVIVVPRITRFFYFKAWFRHVFQSDKNGLLKHWFAESVKVQATPEQTMHCDGEVCKSTSIDARVIPQKLHVLVP